MRILFSSSDLPLVVKHVAVTFESSAVVGGLAGVRGVGELRGKVECRSFCLALFLSLSLIETDTRAQE